MRKGKFLLGFLFTLASLSWFWHAYRSAVGETVEPWMATLGLACTGVFLLGVGVRDMVDA